MTMVTLLIEPERRDRANGLVGTTTGVTLLVTSVISGLLVARDGMFSVLLLTMTLLVAGLVHLGLVPVDESRAAELGSATASTRRPAEPPSGKVDLKGTIRQVRQVPGLLALIGFSCLNNFLGGAFMALMDAYGLSLVSVQAWGLMWGVLSALFIVGGLMVARTGLGSKPAAAAAAGQPGALVGDRAVPAAGLDRDAGRRHGRLHAPGALRRGRRADHPAAGGAVRAAGPGLRLRAERRAGRVAADRVPDRAADPAASSSRS